MVESYFFWQQHHQGKHHIWSHTAPSVPCMCHEAAMRHMGRARHKQASNWLQSPAPHNCHLPATPAVYGTTFQVPCMQPATQSPSHACNERSNGQGHLQLGTSLTVLYMSPLHFCLTHGKPCMKCCTSLLADDYNTPAHGMYMMSCMANATNAHTSVVVTTRATKGRPPRQHARSTACCRGSCPPAVYHQPHQLACY